MPSPESAEHGATGYRNGCRCLACRGAKAEVARGRRQRRALDRFPVASRAKLLRAVRSGATVTEAAAKVGVPHQLVYAVAALVPEFGEQLNDATQR